MAVSLMICDGNPWYLSPCIWTVPGSNPLGAPGLPIVGQDCFLWAHVSNTGSDPVSNATVNFYWGNPAVGLDRTTATKVGTAFVTLNGNDAQDVLCLTPWIPTFVNGGHECVVAEVFAGSDPLPPGPNFNVPTDRHVAQRNLSVIIAPMAMFHFAFEVHNTTRLAQTFTVSATVGDPKQLEPLKGRLGGVKIPQGKGEVDKLGFVASPCPEGKEADKPRTRLDAVEIPGGGRTGFSLVGALKGEAALIHITQRSAHREVGGLSVLVVRAPERS